MLRFFRRTPEQSEPDLTPRAACDRTIASVRRKADVHERQAKWATALIVFASAVIPVLLVASTHWDSFLLGKLLPAIAASVTAALGGWLQFQRPHERWRLYRGYQRAFEVERLKYDNNVQPYHGEWQDRLFVERIAELQLALHDEWSGLVPRSSDLLRRPGEPAPGAVPPLPPATPGS